VPYSKKLLNDNETVALDLHPHWWYFAKAAAALVASIVFGIAVKIFLDGSVETSLTYLAILMIVGCSFWLVKSYAGWATTNFVITNDRIIYRSGVIAKRGIEIPLERVNNVIFSQSMFERMLGAGDLVIESGGETGQQRFTDVRRPGRVKNLIHAQMEVNESRRSNPASAGLDVTSQLERLEGMMERGTLSRGEFEVQKRRLLEG
jgi:uncharacterized membrane protein YdbT with pleckstrin-like domain